MMIVLSNSTSQFHLFCVNSVHVDLWTWGRSARKQLQPGLLEALITASISPAALITVSCVEL